MAHKQTNLRLSVALEAAAVAAAVGGSLEHPVTVGSWTIVGWYFRPRQGQPLGDGSVVRLRSGEDGADVLIGVNGDGVCDLLILASAPEGKVTARKTRAVNFGGAEAAARTFMANVAQTQVSSLSASFPVPFIPDGSGAAKIAARGKPRAPGRPAVPLEDLAEVAQQYVFECAAGVQGAATRTAAATSRSVSTVSSYIVKARKAGLLTETVPGVGGGTLTAKGTALLSKRSS